MGYFRGGVKSLPFSLPHGLGRSSRAQSVAPSNDPFFADVIVLMHFDVPGTVFTDEIPKVWSIGSAAPVQDAARFKFGGSSLNAVNGSISTPSFARMNWGTADFTIQYWQYYSGSGGLGPFLTPFSYGYSTAGGILVQGSSGSGNGNMSLYINGVVVCTETSAAIQGQWYFYEINRQGTACQIRRDGVQTASGISGASVNNAANLFFGGTTSGGGKGSNSFLDDFRITVNHARNDPVPIAPFPNS